MYIFNNSYAVPIQPKPYTKVCHLKVNMYTYK